MSAHVTFKGKTADEWFAMADRNEKAAKEQADPAQAARILALAAEYRGAGQIAFQEQINSPEAYEARGNMSWEKWMST